MERYQPDQYGRMMPDAHGQWVSLRAAEITALDAAQKSSADAQATVEALQRDNRTYIDERHENMKQLEELRQQVEALQAQLESANTLLHKKNCAIGKAETTIEALQRALDHAKKMEAVQKEVADNQTWHVRELRQQHTQLQALVRALPVVRIDLNGAYHDTLLARPEDDAVKELLRYRATLDATTPATTKT